MEAVPSLCATGTVGIAAVGFAFGHPQHSIATRPVSNKRKTPSRVTLNNAQIPSTMPTTPSPHPQPASAPTSRLQKRSSAGRPLTSSSNLRGGIRTLPSTPESKINNGYENGRVGLSSSKESESSSGEIPFEFKGSENTPPSWLRRMSTLSSLKTASPIPTPRPGSPSISYSNASTAPILPGYAESATGTLPRNKLVKRSSSQRVLYGSNTLYSTLRRPATSHQRSATLQQLHSQGEEPSRPCLAAPATVPARLSGDDHFCNESSQRWQPFFKPPPKRPTKDGSLRKRNASGMINRNDNPRNIVPGINELPTLLLASSISSGSSGEPMADRASNISGLSRPFTPIGFANFTSSSTDQTGADVDIDPEHDSGRSFSLGDMFPSPSPSTWRMPRSGSLRSRPFSGNTGRRVVSAPQPNSKQEKSAIHSQADYMDQANSFDDVESQTNPHEVSSGAIADHRPVSSSSLPPLKRLSAFEVDLPSSAPSYPVSQQLEYPPSPQDHATLSKSSPSGPTVKTRPHRFSSAPSDPGSTLLGSDNENSRLLSGDEEDMDARSETIYDSTRTGATGSSHSGIRRPPIDTIFDESPPPELPTKIKLVALQDLLHNDSFVDHCQPHPVLGDEQDVWTPVRASLPRKEQDSPTPAHETTNTLLSPEISSSPPLGTMELQSPKLSAPGLGDEEDDTLWAFDNADTRREAHDGTVDALVSSKQHSPSALLSEQRGLQERRESPPASGQGRSSKPNIFEWSEQPSPDKDSSKGDSPRPNTVHGRQFKETRGSRVNGRRGLSALHLRSQSVPVSREMSGHRSHNNASKLDSWVLGNKGPSEDWDSDFDFEEPSHAPKEAIVSSEHMRSSYSSGMHVPRSILERQASVHGQFGQVKELALLVEELKRLQMQASAQGIMQGQSAELWKEAEGIINLATLDEEERELFSPRTPRSPNFDFESFDPDFPPSRSQRRSGFSEAKEDRLGGKDDAFGSQHSSRPSQEFSGIETPRSDSRPRTGSSAKAKHVLDAIHQQRSNHYESTLLDAPPKKLPFDTTSLKDLVTRAGIVTRVLKDIVRRAENGPDTPDPLPSTLRDPPFISQMFSQPPTSPTFSKSPRVTHSPKTPKSPKSSPYLGGSIATNDTNEINGHMKMMTVV